MALTDSQQEKLYADVTWTKSRVAGMLNQRYYTQDANGNVHPCDADTKGAKTGHALDTLDGNYLQQNIDSVAGLIPQRYYTLDDDGNAHLADKGTAGARAAHLLDTVDGNYLQQSIAELQAQIDKLTRK